MSSISLISCLPAMGSQSPLCYTRNTLYLPTLQRHRVANMMACQDILSLAYDACSAFWVGTVIVADVTSEANDASRQRKKPDETITAPAVASDYPIITSRQRMTTRRGGVRATVSGTASAVVTTGATSGDAKPDQIWVEQRPGQVIVTRQQLLPWQRQMPSQKQ